MRLARFQLTGFAQHRHVAVDFREGEPSLIVGPNEAGKSHLMEGMLGTLFGIVSPSRFRPWNGDAAMLGVLEFQVDESHVRIERRFLEDLVEVQADGEQVYRGRGLAERGTVEDRQYQRHLAGWFGFSELDVFKRTVFVGQDELADRRLGAFTSQFKRLISGTREANYDTAIKALESELDGLVKLPGKRANRQRENLLDQLSDLEHRRQASERVQASVVGLVEEERKLRQQVQDAIAAQERYQELDESYRQLRNFERQEQEARDEWKERDDQIGDLNRRREQRATHEQRLNELAFPGDPGSDQTRRLISEIERHREQITRLEVDVEDNERRRAERSDLERQIGELAIPDDAEPDDIQQLGWDIQSSERQIADLRRQVEEESAAPVLHAEHVAESNGSSRTRTLLLLLSGVAALAAVVLGLLVDPLLYVGLMISVVILAIALVTGRKPASSEVERGVPEAREQRLNELNSELNSAMVKHDQLTAERDELLRRTGLQALEEVRERARQRQILRMKLDATPVPSQDAATELAQAREALSELEKQRDDLLGASGEKDLEALVNRSSERERSKAVLQELEPVDQSALEELGRRLDRVKQDAAIAINSKKQLLDQHPELEDLSAEQVTEYRREITEAEVRKDYAEKRLYEIDLERRALSRGTEDAAELQLHIRDVQAQIERVDRRIAAVQLAIETLGDSVREFQEHALDPVAEQASGHLSGITGGRYRLVELERTSLEPVVTGNGFAGISFDQLSRGTKDQLYLSIRAALIDALSGDRNLPMVLDDPCVNFDDERLAATAGLIAQLARERQILLFTKDETWCRWFEPVLRLERSETEVSSAYSADS